jgi:homoserine O-acetyltransferase/O-succinyltransferase
MVEADLSVAFDPADRAREADHPHSQVVRFGMDKPLKLDAGIDLAPFQVAY